MPEKLNNRFFGALVSPQEWLVCVLPIVSLFKDWNILLLYSEWILYMYNCFHFHVFTCMFLLLSVLMMVFFLKFVRSVILNLWLYCFNWHVVTLIFLVLFKAFTHTYMIFDWKNTTICCIKEKLLTNSYFFSKFVVLFRDFLSYLIRNNALYFIIIWLNLSMHAELWYYFEATFWFFCLCVCEDTGSLVSWDSCSVWPSLARP